MDVSELVIVALSGVTMLVVDALGEQNKQLFNKISDKILKSTKNIWWIFITLLMLGVLIFLLGQIEPAQQYISEIVIARFGVSISKGVISEIGLHIFFFSLTYLFLAFRNRKTRGRVFASALYADACERKIRHRLQIDKVISGGKILGVMKQLDLKRGDHVRIMWSFFYREEHTAGLIDQCLRDRIRVQLILVKPGGYGLRLRMQDLKGPYVKRPADLEVSYKEVSLDNLNFLKDVLNAAEHDREIFELIDVRFVDEYVARPLVIVETDKTLRLKVLNFIKSVLFIFGRNFVPYSEKTQRSAVGIYLAREASKYPFIVYYPETSYADSQVITGDLVDFFDIYWEAGINPFFGPDSMKHERVSKRMSIAELRKNLLEWELRIEKSVELVYGKSDE